MEEQILPEGLQPMKRKHAGAGKKCDEAGAAERNCCGLTIIPHPHAPVNMGGGRGNGIEGRNLNLEKRLGGSFLVLLMGFSFVCLTLFLTTRIYFNLQ